jgi:hypothetical protein
MDKLNHWQFFSGTLKVLDRGKTGQDYVSAVDTRAATASVILAVAVAVGTGVGGHGGTPGRAAPRLDGARGVLHPAVGEREVALISFGCLARQWGNDDGDWDSWVPGKNTNINL